MTTSWNDYAAELSEHDAEPNLPDRATQADEARAHTDAMEKWYAANRCRCEGKCAACQFDPWEGL